MSLSTLTRSASAAVLRRAASPLRRTAPAAAPLAALQQQRRAASDTPDPQSGRARLWEGHPEEHEGWEYQTYAMFIATVVVVGSMKMFAPDTTIQTWANNEAQARIDLLREGKIQAVEFGVHYNTPEHLGLEEEWDKFAERAARPGEDDDDDDDDEDEEDEDEDEDEEEEDDGDDDDDE